MDQKTGQSRAKVVKPSPNEEETIIRNALAERRKQRLLQVRKQEKNLSGKIRNVVRKKREEEMTNFRLLQERDRSKNLSKEIEELEAEYRSRIESLGEGHRAAKEIPIKASTQVSQAMKQRTLQRYEEALKKLEEHKTALKKPEEEKAVLRQKVAQTEKSRASVIASKPPPIQDFVADIDRVSRQATFSTRTKGTDSFGSSRFHIPQVYAEKADGQVQVDARNAARDFEERIIQGRELLEKDLNERNEKANLRHHHARQQVLLDQSKERLLEQLDELEFKDRVRRQQILSKIPKQVFQPPYQRVEDAKAKQIVLEEAFENAHLTNKNVRENELVLDLKDELEALERDLAQHEPLRKDLNRQSNESSIEPRAQAQQEPKVDTAPSAPMTAVKAEPSKIMQKLLGRIRQQQDEWSKQNADRRMDKLMEDEQIRREQSSESLVSANIDSARYTNSNTESTENGKAESNMKEEEQFSEHDKHVQDTPDKDNLLFHPFEKAKLIRSAGKKRDEYVENGLTSSTSLDLDKRKKTLENQKYLFKIQKQRLENQLLRRDLQTAEKALGLLVEENGILSRQESLSEFSSPRAAEEDVHRMSLSNENEESSVELKESAGESECNQPLDTKEPVHIPDEEKQVNDIDSSSTITGSDSDESTEQVGMSFVSGMSDIQRETLSKRYPNIFKGLSFVKQDKVESQSRTDSNFLMDDKQDKTIAGGLSLPKSLNATPESDVTESASRNTAKGLTTTLSHASKPRIEIERIRKYQEQLLQKQKWLKNRQNVLQKRHKEMLSEFAQADGKGRANEIQDSSTTASISLSENVGSLQVTDKPIVTSNVVEMSEEKHSIETQLECKLNAARMIDADSVVGDRMSYRDDVGTGLEEEAPVQPLGPLGTNRELAIDSSKERVFWESEIHALPDEKEEQGKLDQGDVENIFAVQRGCGMEAVGDSSSRRHSHFDGLQNLLSEIDSIHLQANTTAIERISHDIPSRGALKRSHGVVAEKPAVSPIQEVEETPYKERSVVASQDQGAASVSSLVEQELPPSTRSSSEINHFSPVRSSKSTERSEISVAFSLRELVSSLSETEFLPFPNQVPVKDTKRQLSERHKQGSTGLDVWTPLQPYHSAPKDDEAPSQFQHPDQLKVSTAVAKGDPLRPKLKGDLDFDQEKYKRLVQEHLYIPTVSLGNFGLEDVYSKQTRSPDIVEMGTLQEQINDLTGVDELRLPEIPHISSRNSGEQRTGTSMRETNAIPLSSTSSSSSKLSKGSSTNMSKYEEVLEHVRMLPYKYLEEYNKLSESYQSWRKETVEPLLQPEIPEYFGGNEIFANGELDFDTVSLVSELQSRVATSSDLAFQPFHNSHIDSESENTTGLKADVQELMPPRIHLHEPVVDFEFYDEDDVIRNGRFTRMGGKSDEETREMIYAEGTLLLHAEQVFIDNAKSLDGNFLPLISKIKGQGYDDDFLMEKDESLHSDQLEEQKFSETVSEVDLQDESLYLERYEAVDSVRKGETAKRSKDWRLHKVDTEIKIVPPNKERPFKYDDQTHNDIVKQGTSDIAFEAQPRRFLEPYISSFGSSSATKSLLTSSPSRKSKSFLSSGLRSDETVSELARLWSRDDEENEKYTRTRSSQKSSSSAIHGSSTSSTSAPTRSEKVLIKRNESLTDHSIGFKDPNNYDISLYKSTSSKTSKSQDGQLVSDKSGDSSNLPTFPKFASTLLVDDRPFFEGQEPVSPSLDMERSLHESLDTDPFRAAVEGHSETSWLLQPEALKEQSDGNITSENGLDENNLSVGNVHSLDSSEDRSLASKDSPFSVSSFDGYADYKSTQRWDELLSAQISGSSAKESDGELPEVLKLKKETFIRRSQQRVQQNKRKSTKKDHQHTNNDYQHTKNDHQHTKYRVDGRVETKHGKKPDKENKNPTSMKTMKSRMGKKALSSSVSGGKPDARDKSHSSSQSDEKNQKHAKVLQENRRRVQQFQKKIQSSLRNRRK